MLVFPGCAHDDSQQKADCLFLVFTMLKSRLFFACFFVFIVLVGWFTKKIKKKTDDDISQLGKDTGKHVPIVQ